MLLFSHVNVALSYNLEDKDDNLIDELLFNIKVHIYMKIISMPSLTVCVIKNDSIIWSNSYGFSNLYQREKAKLDTIYVIGSISKTVIATAIMQLYERGLLKLDDDISMYLPYDLRNPKFPEINVTFRMLLAHQASLNDGFYDYLSFLPLIESPSEWINERLTPEGKYYKEEFWKCYSPGKEVNYSNWGFILLAALLEEISGQTFEDFCQENIFQPLNMTDTSFNIDKLDKNRFAKPHYPITGSLYIPLPNYDIKCASACGGLRTTATDLSNFMIAHMNNGTYCNYSILNESTMTLMHSLQYPNHTQPFYKGYLKHCLGWIYLYINNQIWEGYNGGAIGYCCNMMFRQSDQIGVVFLMNGHFRRISGKYADYKLNKYYEMADLFIDRALENN